MTLDRFSKGILWAIVGCGILLLLYSGVRFGVADQPPASLAIYYGMPLVAALLGMAVLRRPPALRANFALLVLSLGFAAYLAEATVRATDRLRGPSRAVAAECAGAMFRGVCAAARAQGLPFDTRSAPEVLAEADDSTLTPPFVTGGHLLAYPPDSVTAEAVFGLGFVSRSRILLCNESGRWIEFQSDEYGFRNPQGAHSADVEAVLLGDSFAQGYCVEEGDTPAAAFREAGVGVLSLGIGGAGPLRELAALREYATPLAPPVVFWMFYDGNDPSDLNVEAGLPELRRYTDPGYAQALRTRQPLIDAYIRSQTEIMYGRGAPPASDGADEGGTARASGTPGSGAGRADALLGFALLRSVRSLLGRSSAGRPTQPLFNRPLFERALAVADTSVRAWGGRMYLVYIPSAQTLRGDPELLRLHDDVSALARELGLPLIDALETLSHEPDPLSHFPFRLGLHYTPEAYRILARLMLEALPDGA